MIHIAKSEVQDTTHVNSWDADECDSVYVPDAGHEFVLDQP